MKQDLTTYINPSQLFILGGIYQHKVQERRPVMPFLLSARQVSSLVPV